MRCGGGFNHRFGLDDAILIKDNHIAVAGGIAAGAASAPRPSPDIWSRSRSRSIRSTSCARCSTAGGADVVLLDNMEPADMRKAVEMVAGPAGAGSLRRHHAGDRRRDRRDRRRLSLVRRDHAFGAQSRRRARYRDVDLASADSCSTSSPRRPPCRSRCPRTARRSRRPICAGDRSDAAPILECFFIARTQYGCT